MTPPNTHILQELGLKETEIDTYVALLKSGPTSIRSLAAATGINRGLVYESLKQLTTLGLVAYNRRGERYRYQAESPEQIQRLIAERQQALTRVKEEAADLIPNLMALSERVGDEPLVRFYEDDEGVATILRDVLHTTAQLPDKLYYAYSSRTLRKYLYRRFPAFTRQRIKAGVRVRVIAVGEGGEPAEHAERRWLAEAGASRLSSYMLIYGPKLALISVAADDTPYGVVIEEPGVAAMQRLLFDTLWDRL